MEGVEKTKNLVEKGVLASLGFWLLVHEKADEVIKELIEKGRTAPEERKHFLEDLSRRVDDEKEEIKKKIKVSVNKTLEEAGCVTEKDIDGLTLRLDELEGRIAVLERKEKPTAKK